MKIATTNTGTAESGSWYLANGTPYSITMRTPIIPRNTMTADFV